VRCGKPIYRGEPVDLDHHDDRPGWAGMAHARCNRAAGARRGNALRKVRIRMHDQVLAVAISLDRQHTAILAAGRLDDDTTAVEVAGYLDGTDTAPAVRDLAAERNVTRCVVDPRSPAATIIAALKTLGLDVIEPNAHDLAVAHGRFIDELRAGRLRYVPHPALTAAVQHADTRPLAGAEALARRHVEADAAPLEAAELAAWGLLCAPPPRLPSIYVYQPATNKEDAPS
jgi:hypothetical protein